MLACCDLLILAMDVENETFTELNLNWKVSALHFFRKANVKSFIGSAQRLM